MIRRLGNCDRYLPYLFFALISFWCHATEIPPRKTYKFLCQDIIINNQVIEEHNHRDCKTRYTLLEHILGKYKRPFTMLELGAKQGYFSLRAASTYPQSTFVMIEDNSLAKYFPSSDLLEICKRNTCLHNIVLFNREIVADELERLSECEHFDLVIAFNLFSSCKNNCLELIEPLLKLGDNILLEVPNWHNELNEYLSANNIELLCTFEHSKIWLREGHKNILLRRHWLRPLSSTLTIKSTYEEKKLIKNYDKLTITDWIPGINLITFKMYSGIYPTFDTVRNEILKLKDVAHTDWLAHNMIVQGDTITMIDCNDPRHENENIVATQIFDEKRERILSKILEWIKINNPKEVASFYIRKHMENW